MGNSQYRTRMGGSAATPRLRRFCQQLVAATAVLSIGVVAATPDSAFAAAPVGVTTVVATSNSAPLSGQPFTITLSYSCASVVVDCLGAGLVLNLPVGLDNPTSIIGTAHVTSTAFSTTSRNIRFYFVNPLPAGSTGQVSFQTAFTMGTTAHGQAASFVASMYTTNVGTDASNTVTVTAAVATTWAAQTVAWLPGPIGTNTTFKVWVCDTTSATYGRANLIDEVLTDWLPVGATFVSASDGGIYYSSSHKVMWNLTNVVVPGTCMGSVTVVVNFPSATFTPGQVVTNRATGRGNVVGPLPLIFTPAVTNLTLSGPNPVVTTTKTTTTTNLIPGDPITYTFSLKNTGNVPLTSVSLTDVFPQGMSILPGGTIGIGNTQTLPVEILYSTARSPRTTATWVSLGTFVGTSNASVTTAPNPLPSAATGITAIKYKYGNTLAVGKTLTLQLTVMYDDVDDAGNPILVGTPLNNCAISRWQYGATFYTGNPCANLTVPAANPSVALTMNNCCSTPAPGQKVQWDWTATNNGNVHVGDTLVNIFPNGNVVKASQGIGSVTLSGTAARSVQVYYSTATAPRTSPTWTLLSTLAFTSGARSFNLTAPAAPVGGTAITGMRYVFMTPHRVGENFSGRNFLEFTNLFDNSTPIPTGTNLNNCVSSAFTYRALSGNAQACKSLAVPAPWLNVLASNAIGGSYPTVALGANFTAPLLMNNTNSSWYSVTDPVVVEVVPSEVVPSGASWASSYTIVSQPGLTFVAANDFSATPLSGGRTALRWKFHGNLAPNTGIRIDLTQKTAQHLWNTQLHQNLHAHGSSPVVPVCTVNTSALGIGADPENVTGMGVASQGCKARWGHTLAASAALGSMLGVKGSLDSGYVSYPTKGQTFDGGLGDYRLTITNRGTVPVGSVVVIDKLPTLGDTAVVSTASRGSQFSLNLAGAVVPSDPAIKVYYSVAANPCRSVELGVTASGCTAANWMSVVPSNPTVVKSVKFDFTTLVIQPAQAFTLDWPMRVPVGTPAGKTAYNSVGFAGTRTDTNSRLLASEPLMTGLYVNPPVPNIFGGTVWSDGDSDGRQDAGELGVNGVQVKLYTSTGTLVGTSVSATDFAGNAGQYSFGNLADGTYYAVFNLATIPQFATVSPKDVGANDAIDSDADPITGQTANVSLSGLVTNLTIDMGVHLSGCDDTSC